MGSFLKKRKKQSFCTPFSESAMEYIFLFRKKIHPLRLKSHLKSTTMVPTSHFWCGQGRRLCIHCVVTLPNALAEISIEVSLLHDVLYIYYWTSL